MGEDRDYHGSSAIGGTHFVVRRTIPLGIVRSWRNDRIAARDFDTADCLARAQIKVEDVQRWTERLWYDAEYIDPLARWHSYVRYIKYNRRQEFRHEALLAEDLREMAEVLAMFLHQLGHKAPILSEVLLPGLATGDSLPVPHWMEQRFGKGALSDSFEMLEYVANDLGINPRPRAIVLTEGEEWRAFERLFEHYGFDPKLLGIEFRSLGGEGEFSVANWQCFVEYMHEKQVFVYFVVDREGRAAREARKLLKAKRKFRCEGLTRVIPARDRIMVWRACFESSNFTGREIAVALKRQNLDFDARTIESMRRQTGSQGLIKRVVGMSPVNKRRLVEDLADILVARRVSQTNEPKRLRKLERCVITWGGQVVLNHLPTGARVREVNRKSRLLG